MAAPVLLLSAINAEVYPNVHLESLVTCTFPKSGGSQVHHLEALLAIVCPRTALMLQQTPARDSPICKVCVSDSAMDQKENIV